MKRVYYGWVVCLVSTLLLFVTMGTVSNGFSVYLPYIMAEHGLTNAQTSSLVTLRCLVSFFAMLGIGLYYQKVSIRVGVGISAACVSLFMGALANPGFSHLSVLYTSEGFDPMVVAAIISAAGVMITLGKLLYGEVTDRLGGYIPAYLMFSGFLAMALLCIALAYRETRKHRRA